MADLISMLAAVAGSGGGADPNFKQTVLLLHGDGTNGAQNNTFLDGSTNNFTITRNGNTTQGTFSPFSLSDGYWSNFFDGTNDRLTIADNAVLRPGTGNFTIEAWVYRAAAGAAHTIFAKGASTPTGFAFLITSSDTLRFTDTSTDITSTGTVAANTWVHVAVAREGTGSNQLKLYINGVQDGQGTVSTDFNQTEEARIGENRGATDDFNGYISNFRYVVGSAIYTAGFTPSTSPLTTTSQGAVSSEVELLTCQSNRFVDNSTNGFTVTPVNNIRVTPFSPFAPTAAYSADTNGGSGYFDGTGDYLNNDSSNALDFGSGNFTVEMWVYRIGTGSQQSFLGGTSNLPLFEMDAGNVRWQVSATTGGAIPVGAWSHIVWVREGTGSNQCAAWLNGSRVILTTDSTSYTPTSFAVGGRVGGSVLFTGYIGSLRVVKSAEYAVSSTTISVPTAPFTAIANTSLLLNFTNAGIFDNTGKNNLETVADAQIDTTTKKFGTGSMKFDGNNDYLRLPSNIDLAFGTGDFTIEVWVYRAGGGATGSAASQIICDFRTAEPQANIVILKENSGTDIEVYIDGSLRILSTTDINLNTWYYIALVRASGSTKLYINGVNEGSTYSDTNNYTSTNLVIGGRFAAVSGDFRSWNGFFDDLRITKGVARYTANFTPPPFPPTAAFPDL